MTASLSKSKKACWDTFSLYIRTRDALRTTGTLTHCKCVTCNRIFPLKGHGGLQAGHWIPNRHPSILLDERQVHAQCYGCNVMKKGAPIEYWLFMEKTYGREVMDEIIAKDKLETHYKAYQYDEWRELYKQKINDMIKL